MRLLVPTLLLALSGCAISPVERGPCLFTRYQLDVPTPGDTGDAVVGAALAEPGPSAFGRAVARALGPPPGAFAPSAPSAPSAPAAPASPSGGGAMLFLSGGGQHGAFGAGYLAGWKAGTPDKRLPAFDVVTGISTGAILSTFAFIDRPEVVERAYAIRSERELLTPLVTVRGGAPTTGGYVGLVKKGAIADLAPLRGYLRRVLTPEMLRAVADRAEQGRLLVVGVVDVDTGDAVALDLGDMARRAIAAGTDAERGRLRDCYAEAIVASSSAPLAALPVFIDGRMYIDGGARFGAFSDEIGDVIERAADPGAFAAKPTIHLIISGDQRIASRCGRRDRARCAEDGSDPPGDDAGEHRDWTFLDLALRSEGILANQVYRFSADSIAFAAARRGIPLHYVQIERDMTGFRFDLDDEVLGRGSMTCAEARATDKRELDPVQFFPRYMRCLLAYGRARASRPDAAR